MSTLSKTLLGIGIGVAVITFYVVFFNYDTWQENATKRTVTINVEEVFITGEWRNYIEVRPGRYKLEVVDDTPRISVRLVIKAAYAGTAKKPSDTLELIVMNKTGAELNTLRIESQDRFNEFIMGQPGDSLLIAFSGIKNTRAGVHAWTQQAGSLDMRTIIPRSVAIPELVAEDNAAKAVASVITGNIISGLTENRNISNVVDYNQLQATQRQLRFEASDWSDTSKYAEIGRVLNVDTIAVGTIKTVQERRDVGVAWTKWETFTYQSFNLQLIDISTLQVVGSSNLNTEDYNIRASIRNMNIKSR